MKMIVVNENGDVHVEYHIPEDIKAMISDDFLKELRNQLFRIHEYYSLETFADQGIPINTSTAGWYAAFGKACLLKNKSELLDYWENLEWYDSDIFDGIVADMLVEKKLILNDSKKVIAEQLNIDPDEIEMCDECYRYYPKDFLIKQKENEESEYICPHCQDMKDCNYESTTEYYRNILEELRKRKENKNG